MHYTSIQQARQGLYCTASIAAILSAALQRLCVAHFPQMTWDRATNLAAVARGGASLLCFRRGTDSEDVQSDGMGEGSQAGCIGAVHKTEGLKKKKKKVQPPFSTAQNN